MLRSSVAAFYPWLVPVFYSSARTVRGDELLIFRLLLRLRSEVEEVIHGMPEILFAAEIMFCGLDRCMPEQELNLLQFTTAIVAQPRAGSPQVMRCDVL